ncbi:MAG: hypothetical protein HRU21_09240 [Pseudomonadales bacterium]|nr:hypothetical protein [Pseudomonadales bacterium]
MTPELMIVLSGLGVIFGLVIILCKILFPTPTTWEMHEQNKKVTEELVKQSVYSFKNYNPDLVKGG